MALWKLARLFELCVRSLFTDLSAVCLPGFKLKLCVMVEVRRSCLIVEDEMVKGLYDEGENVG